MGLRETMSQNTPVGIAIAVILLLIAGGISYWSLVGFRPAVDVAEGRWFYDVDSGKLFAADLTAYAPIEAPSGGQGLQAHVFTCDDSCGGHDLSGLTPAELEPLGLILGFVERLRPEGQERLEQIRQADVSDATRVMQIDMTIMKFSEVRLLNTKEWAPKGQALSPLHNQLAGKCQKRATACFPGRD